MDNPVVKIVFALIIVLLLFLGFNYFTTETRVGAELKDEASDVIFNLFTDEYERNAEVDF